MPRALDSVKAMVAQTIQHHLVTIGHIPDIPPRPDDVESVEGHAISPTETLVRIKVRGRGTRYIKVKVSEMM